MIKKISRIVFWSCGIALVILVIFMIMIRFGVILG